MQNIRKKLLSILLTIIMIVTALPMTASAEDTVTVIEVSNAEELTTACSTINENGGTYTISMKADFEGSVSINNPNAVVTLVGNGHTLSGNTNFININHGTLNLGDGKTELTLKGGSGNDNPGIVYIIYSDAVCNMYDKVTIKDHEGNTNLGGGVTVESGVFHMYGGTIDNCGIDGGSVCYGGGVAVLNSGAFTMNGGTITNCYVTTDYTNTDDPNHLSGLGGGVFVTSGSVFTMNGGTISKCSATNNGGGVAVVSAVQNGNFKSKAVINGGTISENTASGGAGVYASGLIYAYGKAIAMDATIDNAPSSGTGGTPAEDQSAAQSDPGLYINGGTITDNTAVGTYDKTYVVQGKGLGGGILASGMKSKVRIHNAEISSNKAEYGAGIAAHYYNTNPDIDNCTITANVAEKNGGGIMLLKNTVGTFVKNTTVTGNTSCDRGAGIYYDTDSKLTISGANTVQENYYNGVLNNLNVLSKAKPVYVDGDLTGSKIGLSDPTLWDDGKTDEDPQAVSTEYLTNGYKANNPEVHPEEYFTSDHETWYVDRSAKTTTTQPDPNSKIRRAYKVKRYAAVLPNTSKYAGLLNQYVISDIQNPDLQGKTITSYNDIVSELRYRFESSNNYSITDYSNATYGSTYIKYTPKDSDTPLSTIVLNGKASNRYLKITYTAKSQYLGGRGNSVDYTASENNQSRYANSGELVLQITSNGNSDPASYTFSGSCTETTVDYVNLDPPGDGKYLYEYDEYGDVAAKLEIVSYTPKSATITVETGNEDEVRLVRRENAYKVVFHENNPTLGNKNVVFKTYQSSENGMKIDHFYDIPAWAGDEYVFAGWYHNNDYSKSPDEATFPVDFENDTYSPRESGADYHIYAKWIKVGTVGKDTKDANIFDGNYRGFGLVGVQFREPGMYDDNYEKQTPGGLRFVTSLSEELLSSIDALSDQKVDNVDVEYGYAVGTEQNINAFISHYEIADTANYKLQYKGENVNGVDTDPEKGYGTAATDFRYITNVNCTRGITNADGTIKKDHRNFTDYRLYTLVVTYEGDSASKKNEKIDARAYIRYYDANNKLRVFYNDYKKDTYYGGCLCSFDQVEGMAIPQNPDLLEEQQRPEG